MGCQVDDWMTPKITWEDKASDCYKIEKKNKIMEEDSSQKSKWEEFRKMRSEFDTAECSYFLRTMQLEDSDDEEEVMNEEEMLSLKGTGIFEEMVVDHQEEQPMKDKKEQIPKKNKWGSVLRTSRPRRFPEDGRTIIQKAIDYAKYLNLEVDTK